MRNCTGCNEPIHRQPPLSYGGDWYASCDVCEWHSEGDERTTIKQGLTLEELVAHKKKLNRLCDRLHGYAHPLDMLDELRDIMKELLDEEE